MKQDIILAGVGGQGILSIAFVIDNAALADGLQFKQAEVHGMAQRGGAVQSHLRLSTERIWSDLIPKGGADMILSVEPLEALRYFDYLTPDGIVVTSSTPYKNVPDYPDLDKILAAVRKAKRSVIVDSESVAKEAGTSKAQNIVMLGAASPFLVLKEASLRSLVEALFKSRGPAVVESNIKAFELGRRAAAGAP
ncbi:MAG: indolepyruvate oxidoreductase subunit beta [Candidatus Aminicenantales bacterium]